MSNLVIVESPAKAKTIKKYLGSGYEVVASMGHIRDLPKSKIGVDIEHGFKPDYIEMKDKKELISSLKKQAKKSDKVYLATDPDREGEAISWHLAYILGLDLNDQNRVTFNEITKSGVKNGMEHPRTINIDLVNAQQARRILDRIVGYKLSPFLWKKVRRGLSAGRVQSVTVRLICDREEEIRKFVSEEYWTIDAKLLASGSRSPFAAKFYGTPEGKMELANQEETDRILAELEGEAFTVGAVKKGIRRKSPAPPFSTSTLQQEASRKLGFQARRTMKAAQELYEGVEVAGMGAVGLITYMRTDSLRISDEAQADAAKYIGEKFGTQYLPPSKRVYKSKSNAQDGHEAIRPTMIEMSPDKVKDSLSADQYKLYKLIWERFLASQMANALYNTVAADIHAGKYLFKASGFSVKFDGFTVLYDSADKQEKGTALPPLEKGDALQLHRLSGDQHFTEPPARYKEASLIKTLEENGIGRPSTYAPIITTIIDRGYVEREQKKLKPTLLGRAVDGLMLEQFPHIVDVDFSAEMEKNLDKVESGKTDWHKTVDDFYKGFAASLEQAEKNMEGKKVKVPDEPSSEVCDLCGRPMVIKVGKYGKFLACSGFPECRGTKRLVKDTGGICPKCGKGRMLERKSAKGRIYYGCERYPDCDFMTWDMPVAVKCEKCGSTLFRKGSKLYCAKEGCDFEMPVPKKD